MAVLIKASVELRVHSKYSKDVTELLNHDMEIPYPIDLLDEDGDLIPEEVSLARFFIKGFMLDDMLAKDANVEKTLKEYGVLTFKEVASFDIKSARQLTKEEQKKFEQSKALVIYDDPHSVTGAEINAMKKKRELFMLMCQLDTDISEDLYRQAFNKVGENVDIDQSMFEQSDITTIIASRGSALKEYNVEYVQGFLKMLLEIDESQEKKRASGSKRRSKSAISEEVEDTPNPTTRGKRNAR